MVHSRTPIIVGVGQILNRIESLQETEEPVDIMLRACRQAEQDTTVRLLQAVQSVRVIRGLWQYGNPARYIAEEIGAGNVQTVGTLFGGNLNQVLVNDAASTILRGDMDLILITGAETGNSLAKARKQGIRIPMKTLPGDYDVLFGTDQKPEHHEFEQAKGIRQAISAYPIYENRLRYQRGETIDAHLDRVSRLWSGFSAVATDNPNAWIRERISAETIRTPSARNRQISFPYTKLMNSNNAVDMGAALILCSVGKARTLGIPEDRWVYPHAGVEGYDHFAMSVRDNFHTSPCIRLVGQKLFELTGLSAGDLDYVDLYSCFPSAVQIAADELGLSHDRPLTVTGGLTFGGGPLNNYVMHSIARTVELLRQNPSKKALVTANGGNVYKAAHGIYSGEPPAADFVRANVQAAVDALPARTCLPEFTGNVEIESYTVMFNGDSPGVGHLSCLTPQGHRVWVNTRDPELMQAMTTEEFCGRRASVTSTDDRVTIRS
jgi:acetyl-CoA C-acetyltransferase